MTEKSHKAFLFLPPLIGRCFFFSFYDSFCLFYGKSKTTEHGVKTEAEHVRASVQLGVRMLPVEGRHLPRNANGCAVFVSTASPRRLQTFIHSTGRQMAALKGWELIKSSWWSFGLTFIWWTSCSEQRRNSPMTSVQLLWWMTSTPDRWTRGRRTTFLYYLAHCSVTLYHLGHIYLTFLCNVTITLLLWAIWASVQISHICFGACQHKF